MSEEIKEEKEKTFNERMLEETIEYRKKLHSIVESAKNSEYKDRYLSLTIEWLELGRAYLGRALGVFGSESPYPSDSSNKLVPPIPITDQSNSIPNLDFQNVEVLRNLRQICKTIGSKYIKISRERYPATEESLILDNIYLSLLNANYWLGYMLNDIAQSSNKNSEKEQSTQTEPTKEDVIDDIINNTK